MSVSSFYTLEMKVNGLDFPDPLSMCTFALQHSILELYPKLVLSFADPLGIMQEGCLMENGTKIELRLMVGDTPIFRTLFYTYKQDTDDIKDIDTGGGHFTVKAIHVMAWKQYKKSRAFRDRISEIVKKIGTEYGYQTDINDTGNADIWYQCNLTDGEYLMNQLLPNAWSHNAEGSPFYIYLDFNNVLHCRHFKSFVRKSPKFYMNVGSQSDTVVKADKTVIQKGAPMFIGYKRDTMDAFDFARAHLVDTWEIARESGGVNQKVFDNYNQPKTNSGHLFLLNAQKKSLKLLGTGFTNPEVGKEETTKGSIVQVSRFYPGIEKITAIVVFHTDTWLDLGDVIGLAFTRADRRNGAYSEKMSDSYVVTEIGLMWDRDKAVMTSRLVLTRVTAKLPKGLKNEPKFLKLVAKSDSQNTGD